MVPDYDPVGRAHDQSVKSFICTYPFVADVALKRFMPLPDLLVARVAHVLSVVHRDDLPEDVQAVLSCFYRGHDLPRRRCGGHHVTWL